MDVFWSIASVIGITWAFGFIFAYFVGSWYYRKQDWFMRHGPDPYFFDWYQQRYILARALMSVWQLLRLARWMYFDWQRGR